MATTKEPVSTPDTLASPADPGLLAKRRARIREFEKESLDRPDHLEAVLGSCAGDLMRAILYLRECLEQAWSQDGEPLDQLSQVLPCLAGLGKLSQQLESLVALQASQQQRRLLAKEIRSLGSKNNHSNKLMEQMLPAAVSSLDQDEPPTHKPKANSKKRPR